MVILACTLFVFLIVAIVLSIKLMGVAKEIKKLSIKGQDVATKAGDLVEGATGMVGHASGVVSNVRDLTSVGGLVKSFVRRQERKMNARAASEEAEAYARATSAADAASAAQMHSAEGPNSVPPADPETYYNQPNQY